MRMTRDDDNERQEIDDDGERWETSFFCVLLTGQQDLWDKGKC